MKNNPFFYYCAKIWAIALFTIFISLALIPSQSSGKEELVFWEILDLFYSVKVALDIFVFCRIKSFVLKRITEKMIQSMDKLSSSIFLKAVLPTCITFLFLLMLGIILPKAISSIFPMSISEFIAILSLSISLELREMISAFGAN